MTNKKRYRHWYIVRKKGEPSILGLLSAFSLKHIQQKTGLKNKDMKRLFIEKAKRWQITRVFSGLPIFHDYKLQAEKYRNMSAPEDVNVLVPNEFHTEMDGEKILVKVLS